MPELQARAIDPVIHMVLRMRAAALKDTHNAWCWAVDPVTGAVCLTDAHDDHEGTRHTWQVSPWEAALVEVDDDNKTKPREGGEEPS